jgi:hypothetical protein
MEKTQYSTVTVQACVLTRTHTNHNHSKHLKAVVLVLILTSERRQALRVVHHNHDIGLALCVYVVCSVYTFSSVIENSVRHMIAVNHVAQVNPKAIR